jgi:hypothetical protein
MYWILNRKNVKSKGVPVNIIEAYGRRRNTAPLILIPRSRWRPEANIALRSPYSRKEPGRPIEQKDQYMPQPAWTFREKKNSLVPTGIKTPDQRVSVLLYVELC